MTTSTTRRQLLDSIRANPEVTVLIAGAGVNGAGLFRELALQGVDTLLVDKADFCAGTSAASSRLIHGGLRYLENGEFGLVRESLLERNLLLRNAAHYVKPLPTTIPIFAWTAGVFGAAARFFRLTAPKPANRGALLIKLGLTMYDLFTLGNRATPSHRFASRERALELRPQLNPEVVCTATYYDAWVTYPERLCLELVEDAEALSPHARATNYLRVEHAAGDRVTLRDEVTGETVEVRPKLLVNATGAWIDFTNRALGRPTKFIGGTKGSHLVLDHRELYEATRGEMLYFETEDGRVCLIFPFHDKVLAGTTDIRVDDPETAHCDDGEVDYILQTVRAVFPSIAVDRSHVVFTYCGVRPLPSSESAITGQISRDHSCEVTPPGNGVTFPIYSLVGGKWTTFRAFAEQVADQVLDALGRTRRAGSEHLAIGG
ncbi:MAG: glycerol-3-phosphate dehydrogenase/oxidase, partial [Chloroflexota bacterium]|nr:glycerol-3-phosphate dehydrogenase/oxidase [Chloroflexota bacterium]